MTGFRNLSLRSKQMLVIMLTSTIVLLLACTAFGAYEVITFRRTRVQELATLADITANSVTSALEFNVPASAVETLSALRAEPAIIGAAVYRLGGEIFATYDRDGDGIVFSPPAVPAEVRTFERQRLALSRAIMHQGEAIGTVYLESDRKALTARLVRYAGIVGLVFGASLLVALVLFMIIKGMNSLKRKKEEAPAAVIPELTLSEKLLMEIRDNLKK